MTRGTPSVISGVYLSNRFDFSFRMEFLESFDFSFLNLTPLTFANPFLISRILSYNAGLQFRDGFFPEKPWLMGIIYNKLMPGRGPVFESFQQNFSDWVKTIDYTDREEYQEYFPKYDPNWIAFGTTTFLFDAMYVGSIVKLCGSIVKLCGDDVEYIL